MQKFYREFDFSNFDHGFLGVGGKRDIILDSINYNSVTVINTSIAGTFEVVPGLILQVGQSVTFRGNEKENNLGKIIVRMDTFFFANISYGYTVMKKKYIYDAI